MRELNEEDEEKVRAGTPGCQQGGRTTRPLRVPGLAAAPTRRDFEQACPTGEGRPGFALTAEIAPHGRTKCATGAFLQHRRGICAARTLQKLHIRHGSDGPARYSSALYAHSEQKGGMVVTLAAASCGPLQLLLIGGAPRRLNNGREHLISREGKPVCDQADTAHRHAFSPSLNAAQVAMRHAAGFRELHQGEPFLLAQLLQCGRSLLIHGANSASNAKNTQARTQIWPAICVLRFAQR